MFLYYIKTLKKIFFISQFFTFSKNTKVKIPEKFSKLIRSLLKLLLKIYVNIKL